MKLAMLRAKTDDGASFDPANRDHGHEIAHPEARPLAHTAPLADGFPAVGAFVNDRLDADARTTLALATAFERRAGTLHRVAAAKVA